MRVNIKYRTWAKGLPPEPIKLQVPGWSGIKTYDSAQPWQCKPFVDGATYGLEIVYPYDTTVVVSSDAQGKCYFEMESNNEWQQYEMPMPFANFAPYHFGFTSSLDIQTEEGYGTLILPHSRFFTDATGEVPVPSIGLIESDWWPKVFFIAFKAPLANQKYIFRKGEGIAQVLIVPKKISYNITKMNSKEENERARLEADLQKHCNKLYTKKWFDKNNNAFENKYKVLSHLENKQPNKFKSLIDQLNKDSVGNHADKLSRRIIKQYDAKIVQNT